MVVCRHIVVILFCHFHSCSGSSLLERATCSSTHGRNRRSRYLRCNLYTFPRNTNSFRNYYTNRLLCSNWLRIIVILTFTTLRTTRCGPCVCVLVKYRSKPTGNENQLRALQTFVITLRLQTLARYSKYIPLSSAIKHVKGLQGHTRPLG